MLVNQTTGQVLAHQVRVCDTYWRRLRGLMFRRALDPDEVYLFCWREPSRVAATIHSLFVFFPFAVLWLDEEETLVECRLVLPFSPLVAPKRAALCYIEGVPELLESVRVGDRIALQG